MRTDPESAANLEKQAGDPLKRKPTKSPPGELSKNNSAATDLPAGVGDKTRAAALFDRKQRQLAAWVAAIEDRSDLESFLKILQIKDPALAGIYLPSPRSSTAHASCSQPLYATRR